MDAYDIAEVEADRVAAGRLYQEFLRVPSISAGLYVLEAGADDPQRPHQQDEIYYVIAGPRARSASTARIAPCRPGPWCSSPGTSSTASTRSSSGWSCWSRSRPPRPSDSLHSVRSVDSQTDMDRPIRVVVAKPGLDGHDRGAKIIARTLRDAGMEVIYTGLHQTPEQIVETVIQEDADAVGLSILSGAHMTLVPRIMELLREQGAEDVLVVLGGTIPADDIPVLKAQGVAEVYTPGAPTAEIVDFLETRLAS